MSHWQKYTIPSEVLVAHLEGEAVVLNTLTKQYYRLNETAAAIWKALEQGLNVDAITERLVEEFEVPVETAQAELARILGDLREKRLITT